MENNIAVPDASGVFLVAASAPLYVNASGFVALDQSQIVQVGQLGFGSIGRSFGMHCWPVGQSSTSQLPMQRGCCVASTAYTCVYHQHVMLWLSS